MTERNGNGDEHRDTDRPPPEAISVPGPREQLYELVERAREMLSQNGHMMALLQAIGPRVQVLIEDRERLEEQVFVLTGAIGSAPSEDTGAKGGGLLRSVSELKSSINELSHEIQADRSAREHQISALDRSLWASAIAYDGLAKAVGQPPDETGKGGTGLRGAVAVLLRDLHHRTRQTGLVAAGGAGGVVAVIEIMRLLLQHFG